MWGDVPCEGVEMSTEDAFTADSKGDSSGDNEMHCAAPSCWERAQPVTVADETDVPAWLCERHLKTFLEVSS